MEKQKESFTAATSLYFTLLSSIDVRLRRSIYALEEADIIQSETTSRESQSNLVVPAAAAVFGTAANNPQKQTGGSKVTVTGGGLGTFDVGWVNSRNDNVGREMEKDTWEEAEWFVARFEKDTAMEKDSKPVSA